MARMVVGSYFQADRPADTACMVDKGRYFAAGSHRVEDMDRKFHKVHWGRVRICHSRHRGNRHFRKVQFPIG